MRRWEAPAAPRSSSWTLRAAKEPETYGAALREEIRKVRSRHERARSHDFELGERKAGFGRQVPGRDPARSDASGEG